tara:strand:+ start:659 stop:814 length:156 start_codon:yes stop_codon:yes gene_type:complete
MSNEDYIRMFLEWLNDFASLDRFSEYYGIDTEAARKIILRGKDLHNRKQEA